MLIRDCVHSGLCHSGWCPFGMVSIRDRVHSGLCPFGMVSIRDRVLSGSCPFGIVCIRDCVHSGLCPFGMVSIRDGVHSGLRPFGIVSIRDCVHSGWCTFGIVSIRDRVHSGWCPFGIVSIRDCVHSGWCPFGIVYRIPEHVPAYHPHRRQNQSCTAQQPCSVYASTRQPLGPAAYEFLVPRPTVRPLYHDQPVYFDDCFVPKPELPKFDGNPLNYKNFMLNFETHIEFRFRDPKILLCLLLHHCDRKIRDRIQHFSDKGISGYRMARDRLEREFGQPCIIAEACEQRLKGSSVVKSNDPESLKEFSELLEKTLISLEDIHCYGSINSLDTTTHLINKLPYDMRKGWVKKSLAIQQRTSKVAEFSDFVNFVEREAEAANSLYGRRLLTSQSKLRSTSKPLLSLLFLTNPTIWKG